ncbi:MAG: hypothetical protein K9J24_10085 [Bacteroidales bacterium]|nr:hypothetical protein [Bacteroidales bacterium]
MKIKQSSTKQLIKSIIFILSSTIMLYACTEIFDYDIRNDKVELLSPPNNYQTDIATQSFYWNQVEFADRYILQIASPGFGWIEYFLVDTLLTKNSFSYTLYPGEFQWRVKALNNSYETDFTTHTLKIDSSNDISGETLQLLWPYEADTTNQLSIRFKWMPLYNATQYNFELYYQSNLILIESTPNDTLTISLEAGEGKYVWRTQAVNQISETQFSERYLYLDTTSPSQPVLIAPDNNSYLPDSATHMIWQRTEDQGSRQFDSLFVYTDSLLVNEKLKIRTNQTTYVDSLGTGTYYWRVRTFDIAGNSSTYSETWKFTINQ